MEDYMNTRHVDLRLWRKHSHAPSRRKVNSSKTSKAFLDHLEILGFIEVNECVNPYSFWRDTHDDVCEDVRGWICEVLELSEEEEDGVLINSPIPAVYRENSQLSTARKSPDVAYVSSGFLFFQIEVLSGGDRDATMFNLAIGLVDQNRFEKNQGLEISESTGFYFPVGDGFIEKVTCKWLEKDLKYTVTSTALTEEEAMQALIEVHHDQEIKFTAHHPTLTNFTFPMSKQVLKDQFGEDALQVSSGASVVVVNPVNSKVFKCPLAPAAALNLSTFLLTHSLTGIIHTAIPVQSVGRYFQYAIHKPPFSPAEANTCVVPFVKSVVVAIREIHTFGYAHLDIRLENICINNNNDAILIDIDRSEPADKEASVLFVKYSRSEMYQSFSSWKCKQLDWKQLGLMIEGFMPAVEPRHEFLRKLIHLGKLFISEVKCVLVCPIFVGEYSNTDHDEWNLDISV